MVNKTALSIIVSIILTTILVSLVNVGINIVLEEPEYEDFCSNADLRYDPVNKSEVDLQNLNEEYNRCNEEYNAAQLPYNQNRYYILAIIGFALLLAGLYFKENLIQITGLASGGILVAQGIVVNLENEIIVFFSLLAILAIFGVVAYRIIKKTK
jgi:hypothetical protein